MIYQISQFLTHTRVYNILNKHIRYAKGTSAILSHPTPNRQSRASFDQVTRLPPNNASAPLGDPDARWPDIPISQVNPTRYMFACQKSQRSMPCNMVKSGLTWSRGFRRRHLGRRVIALTRLRWPTVLVKYQTRGWLIHFILHRKPALGFKTQGNRRMSSLLINKHLKSISWTCVEWIDKKPIRPKLSYWVNYLPSSKFAPAYI